MAELLTKYLPEEVGNVIVCLNDTYYYLINHNKVEAIYTISQIFDAYVQLLLHVDSKNYQVNEEDLSALHQYFTNRILRTQSDSDLDRILAEINAISILNSTRSSAWDSLTSFVTGSTSREKMVLTLKEAIKERRNILNDTSQVGILQIN